MRFKDSIFQRILAAELAALGDPVEALPGHFLAGRGFLGGLPEERRTYAYAPGKWTLAQVVGHVVDTQLVFLGRILFIARGQPAALPGFDEGTWVETSGHREKTLAELAALYGKGAAAMEALIGSLPAGALAREGNANGIEIRGEEVLAYLIAHEQHHFQILKSRYLG